MTYNHQLTNENPKSQRGHITCLRSYTFLVENPEFEPYLSQRPTVNYPLHTLMVDISPEDCTYPLYWFCVHDHHLLFPVSCLSSLIGHVWCCVVALYLPAIPCCYLPSPPNFQFMTQSSHTKSVFMIRSRMRRDYFWLFYFHLLGFAPSMPELRQGRKENHFNSNFLH